MKSYLAVLIINKTKQKVVLIYRKPMTPKKCMFIAKSLTDPLHVEMEPLCRGAMRSKTQWVFYSRYLLRFFLYRDLHDLANPYLSATFASDQK